MQLNGIQKPLHQQGLTAAADGFSGVVEAKEKLLLAEEGVVGAVALFGLLAGEGAASKRPHAALAIGDGEHQPRAVEARAPGDGGWSQLVEVVEKGLVKLPLLPFTPRRQPLALPLLRLSPGGGLWILPGMGMPWRWASACTLRQR
jgi:hypothetical protein